MIVTGTDKSCNKKVKRVGVVTMVREPRNTISDIKEEIVKNDVCNKDKEFLVKNNYGWTVYKTDRGDILEDLDWVNNNVIHFNSVTKNMVAFYSRKNRDYGNSFDKSLDEDGLLVAKIRLGDKLARFSQLIKMADRDETMSVEDETMIDTLIDLANYAAMTVRYLEEKQEGDSDNE